MGKMKDYLMEVIGICPTRQQSQAGFQISCSDARMELL